jgi:omega-6 fatty acid desaturase (delta-12 desaturase)
VTETANHRWWKKDLAPYAQPDLRRSAIDLLTSVVPYLALMVAMYFALDVSYWLVLALSIPAAGFLVRVFIIFHDCTHGSFLPTKRANQICGIATGFFVWGCFHTWGHAHAVHHGTAGDLDRRGTGDLPTMTKAEFASASWPLKTGYYLFRNPIVMFGLGPIWSMILEPRLWFLQKRPRLRRAALLTNVALAALVTGICLLIGTAQYFLIFAPAAWLAGAAGVFLFYVQHQFEDVYWEEHPDWDYADAALQGSSYLKLPKVLQFFSGNIGLHHVHHLNARVPNYNLQRAHDSNPVFHNVPTLTLADAPRCVRLKLWDESSEQMIGWREYRRQRAAGTRQVAPAVR